MIRKLMMFVATMAAIVAWADPKFGFWVEMHDVPAETCSCIEHRIGKNHYVMTRLGAIEVGKGTYVAIPVYGLDSELRYEDVFVTAGTYKDAGSPFVWQEEKMWAEYGQYFARAYESGDMHEDIWADDDIHWADDCDSKFSPQILKRDDCSGDAMSVLYFMSGSGPVYELVSGIWDDWEPVSGRQWIIVPTPKASSVGKSGKITSFYVTIKAGSQYYSHIVEGVNGTSLKRYKSSNDMAAVGAVAVPFNAGTVSGNGVYKNGSIVALKATASKGYVFVGWYEDAGYESPCDSTSVDYRNPSYSYIADEEDKSFYARFEPSVADTNLILTVDGVSISSADEPIKSFMVATATNLKIAVDSLSLPKGSVKGLPAGMKFTAKPIYKKGSKTEIDVPANTIYGTPTKPGVYKVSVSLTNTSIKKAVVNEFEIVVPNLKDGMVPVEDVYGSYVPGVTYTDTIHAASGCTVTGLPAGMKWTAKDILDSKTKKVVVPANSAYGAPTKPGKYTVYFTKTVDKVKHTATATFIVGDFPVVNVVTFGSGTGKVTGVGAFAANKKVTLKATADTKDDAKKGTKKSVFAGWYYSRTAGSAVQDMNAQAARSTNDELDLVPVESTVDFRTASLPYVMTAEPETTLYAMFVTAEEDSDIALRIDGSEITVNATDNNFVAEGTTILPLQMESISIPKASLSGLPTGMKYTDKTLTVKVTKTEEAYDVPASSIYGTPTKPGLYTVTVKLTNATVKKAIEKKFTIIVPNYTDANHYFEDDYFGYDGNATADGRLNLSVGITNLDDFLPSLKMNSPTAKLAVSGLPAGLKYDAANGKITGIATKAGAYTVTLTVTDGKEKYVSTITIEIEALPDWVVGTFEGYNILEGYTGPSKESGVYDRYRDRWTDGKIHWEMAEEYTSNVSSLGKFDFEWPEPQHIVESSGLERISDSEFSFYCRFRCPENGPYLDYEEGEIYGRFYKNEGLSNKVGCDVGEMEYYVCGIDAHNDFYEEYRFKQKNVSHINSVYKELLSVSGQGDIFVFKDVSSSTKEHSESFRGELFVGLNSNGQIVSSWQPCDKPTAIRKTTNTNLLLKDFNEKTGAIKGEVGVFIEDYNAEVGEFCEYGLFFDVEIKDGNLNIKWDDSRVIIHE